MRATVALAFFAFNTGCGACRPLLPQSVSLRMNFGDLIAIVAVVAILIFFNGLYVGAEFATVSARRTRISQLAGAGDRMARLLWPIMSDGKALDRFVATCQLGITISSLVLGAYGQDQIAPRLEPFLGRAITEESAVALSSTVVLALMTSLQVILGELFPKSLAIQYPEKLALAVVIPIRISQWILTPLIWLFNGSGRLILRVFGMEEKGGHVHLLSAEEIEMLVTESHEGGLLDDEERQMLRNTFRLADLTARQVMVHRTRLVTAPITTSVRDLLEIALEAGYSRIPVYQETLDNIIGFVHVKDVFRLYVQKEGELEDVLREVTYVPEMISVSDVWETLNKKGQYMAIVFDEHGSTVGLVTFEDLIEEVFGELQDEFDDETALVSIDESGRILLRADLLVTDVNEYLGLSLPHEDADTLGGLVLTTLGRRPEVGEEVAIGDTVIRTESVDDLSASVVSIPKTKSIILPVGGEWEVQSDE